MWKVLLFVVFCGVANCWANQDVSVSPTIKIYSTSKERPGFNLNQGTFGGGKDSSAVEANINSAVKHQKIVGFGGTFTDATGININKLPSDVRSKLLQDLFGDDGIGINLCRVPIGATDFSTRDYTLDDHDGDVTLKQFALQNEDLVERIPIIKEALSLRKGSLKLFAGAWTAPIWMKDHKVWMGYSMLSEKYGQVYAEYLKKFLDAYEEKGAKIWGITTGTSPVEGFQSWVRDSMGWIPDLQSKWIKEHLGPVMRNSTHKDVKIIGHDGYSDSLGYYAPVYIEDAATLSYIDGVATHWYDANHHPSINEFAQTDKKDLFLLATETSYGRITPSNADWDKAFRILEKLYAQMQYNYIGWVDYNLVLDAKGGPSHVNRQSDSPIMLTGDGKSYIKTPSYYALGHFSKFVIPGSVRININLAPARPRVYALAFLRPDNVKVVGIYNANFGNVKVQLNDGGSYSHAIDIPSHSVHTMLYS